MQGGSAQCVSGFCKWVSTQDYDSCTGACIDQVFPDAGP
jgi:hypothetical protein